MHSCMSFIWLFSQALVCVCVPLSARPLVDKTQRTSRPWPWLTVTTDPSSTLRCCSAHWKVKAGYITKTKTNRAVVRRSILCDSPAQSVAEDVNVWLRIYSFIFKKKVDFSKHYSYIQIRDYFQLQIWWLSEDLWQQDGICGIGAQSIRREWLTQVFLIDFGAKCLKKQRGLRYVTLLLHKKYLKRCLKA